MLYNQLDQNGNIVQEKVKLSSSVPDLPEGHRWVPYEESLDTIKEILVQSVKDIRDFKSTNGGFKVADKWFHSDPFSRTQHIALTILGNNLPDNIDWKTMDGSKIRLTPSLVQSIFIQAVQQDSMLFSHAEYLISIIKSSQDPSNIDITNSWPETFIGT